jgi:hypothetical protein
MMERAFSDTHLLVDVRKGCRFPSLSSPSGTRDSRAEVPRGFRTGSFLSNRISPDSPGTESPPARQHSRCPRP